MSRLNKETIRTYDEDTDAWLRSVQPVSVIPGTPHHEWLTQIMTEAGHGSRILEIGSGNGRDAAFLENSGWEVQRSDASRSLRDRLEASSGRYVMPLDIIEDVLPRGFDVIMANAVLHHLEPADTMNFIKRAREACKVLAFAVRQGSTEEETSRNGVRDRYFCYWQPEDLVLILRAAEFRKIWVLTEPSQSGDHLPWVNMVAS